MKSSSDDDQRRCFACGLPTRAVPMHRSDKSTTYSQECANPDCADGPSGLLTIQIRRKDTGQVTSATKLVDASSFQHAAAGAPSKNEENVKAVAETFMAAVNRQFHTRYDHYTPGPTTSRAERGHDCTIESSQGAYSLPIQVTRALPGSIYQNQQRQHQRQVSTDVGQVADWVMDAIRRKATRASPDVALVVDGVEAPFLAILTDLAVSAHFQVELDHQKWHSIWIVGPSGARKLAGCALPGVKA